MAINYQEIYCLEIRFIFQSEFIFMSENENLLHRGF